MTIYTRALEPVSKWATWEDEIEVLDEEDVLLDLSAATAITVEIRDPLTDCLRKSATLANGKVTRPSIGVIQWVFPADDMRCLCPIEHVVRITMVLAGTTYPLLISNLPVVGG